LLPETSVRLHRVQSLPTVNMYTVSRLQAKQQLTALVSMATFVAVLDAQLLHGIRTQDAAVTYLEQRANGIQSEPATKHPLMYEPICSWSELINSFAGIAEDSGIESRLGKGAFLHIGQIDCAPQPTGTGGYFPEGESGHSFAPSAQITSHLNSH
jgi:hypothetical protein